MDEQVVVKKVKYTLRKLDAPWLTLPDLFRYWALATSSGIITGAILGSLRGNFVSRGAIQFGMYASVSSMVYLGMPLLFSIGSIN